jgi:hypothetical protein
LSDEVPAPKSLPWRGEKKADRREVIPWRGGERLQNQRSIPEPAYPPSLSREATRADRTGAPFLPLPDAAVFISNYV